MRKGCVILVTVFIIEIFLTTMAFAASEGATTKLERGAKNLAWGWTEIPKNIVETSKQDGAIVGVTVGTVKGMLQAFARTVSGAVDTVTFPAGPHDKPVLKPSMTSEGSRGARK
ncbi:MAG: exosortase system-associated protein, TIGR04073 family [Candidatus Omnitrophica bacterium]|nr:exosortase system-associated protein, TIGR04073 family [Candidatus Omnitrophota bacterium]